MVELHIEPICSIFDLLLGIGLIALGLCGFAIIITVEICYFRKPKKGGSARDAQADRGKHKTVSDTRRSIRSAGLQALFYKLSSKGRPFQTWIRCMPYGFKRKDTEASISALAQVWERSRAH